MAVKTVYELYDFLTPNNAFTITATREGVTHYQAKILYLICQDRTRKKAFIKGGSNLRKPCRTLSRVYPLQKLWQDG